MNKFVLLTVTFGLPLFVFLIANDASKTFFRASGSGLSYVIVEPAEPELEVGEEAVVEVEPEPAEEPEVEVAEAEPEVAEEPVAEEAPVEPVAEDAVQVAVLSDDEMKAAAREVRKCSTCHQLERERNGVGPNLLGVVGRPIGGVDGFRYSDALLALGESGVVWTQDDLVAWLEDPSVYAPGTKMNFKVRDEEARRLIAGWLTQNISD